MEAVDTNCAALKPVYDLLCCTNVPPSITQKERDQIEPGKFPAVTVHVISGTRSVTRVGTECGVSSGPSHDEALLESVLPINLLNTRSCYSCVFFMCVDVCGCGADCTCVDTVGTHRYLHEVHIH